MNDFYKWSGWQDSNLRPPAPKAGAMTGLRYTPSVEAANLIKLYRQPNSIILRREGDSNPRYRYRYNTLAGCRFQPLSHLS